MWIETFLKYSGLFFLIYLVIYATCLWLSVMMGGYKLYQYDRRKKIRNELSHAFYYPVSILVPAYNEEVTIIDTVCSLLDLDYKLYEIIVVDDGSKDQTAKTLIDYFGMQQVDRPIHKKIACQPHEAIYEMRQGHVKLTLIRKKNGGKGDALNMGINAAENPYFLCMDADSVLQKDSLEQIVKPLLEDDAIVAVGGLIRIAQCAKIQDGQVVKYHFPWNPLIGLQVVEYARSFFASRILMDYFNGNLIISGAFGLFKKDVVVAVGGYDNQTLGEDMELVVKLHLFCKNNQMKYAIRYEPKAVCWSQAPSRVRDLITQRRRWHLGLFQSMLKYRQVFGNVRFGMVSFISYMYYLCYELLSPYIEVFGMVVMLLLAWLGALNAKFMVQFFFTYSLYNAILTLTAFFQRMYLQHMKLSVIDIIKALVMCIAEAVFFRYLLAFVRLSAFIGYKKRKKNWGQIQRIKHHEMTS